MPIYELSGELWFPPPEGASPEGVVAIGGDASPERLVLAYGDELLAMARTRQDIVVLDAVMPGLDGFETCRELRVLPGFESLPVLMLTGLDDDASITRAYEAGATDFFVKSTQWRLLAGRLRYLLRASCKGEERNGVSPQPDAQDCHQNSTLITIRAEADSRADRQA